jgi:hypothetical protein
MCRPDLIYVSYELIYVSYWVSYWHVAATIFTLSTFRVGLLDAPGAPPDAGSTVPVISTLCPTCDANFDSAASSLYSLADGAAPPAVPVAPGAPAGSLDLAEAFVRLNFASAAAGAAPVAPVVPAGPGAAFSTHPVTVMALDDDMPWDGDCLGLAGSWASTAMVALSTNAALMAKQIRAFMLPPLRNLQ